MQLRQALLPVLLQEADPDDPQGEGVGDVVHLISRMALCRGLGPGVMLYTFTTGPPLTSRVHGYNLYLLHSTQEAQYTTESDTQPTGPQINYWKSRLNHCIAPNVFNGFMLYVKEKQNFEIQFSEVS